MIDDLNIFRNRVDGFCSDTSGGAARAAESHAAGGGDRDGPIRYLLWQEQDESQSQGWLVGPTVRDLLASAGQVF